MSDRSAFGFSQGYLAPWVEAVHLGPWMAAIAQRALAFETAGLRFEAQPDLSIRPFLPHWNSKPNRQREEVLALRQAVAEAYETVSLQTYDPSRSSDLPMDLSRTIDLSGALVLGIVASSAPVGADFEMQSRGRLAVFVGGVPDLAEPVSAALRRARGPALSVFNMEEQAALAVISLNDDSDAGGTLDGLRAGAPEAFDLLAPVETASGIVWLDSRRDVPKERRGTVSAILNGLRSLGFMDEAQELVILPDRDEGYRFAAIPAERRQMPVAEIAAQTAPETLLSVTALRPVASEEAGRALVERLTSQRFPVGYRVALTPLPDTMRGEPDIELLREEIAEREAEIDLIRALAAPQMRLLRFADAQLPALVDALTHLPTADLRNADFCYAAGHAAGRAEPAHFLLYDPARIAVEGLLREYFWRQKTEDRPMRYWLDPHAARAMEQEANFRTFVFVPVGQRLVPAIDGFGGGLDGTMRLILGNLFAHASAVLEAPDAQPLFLFSPPGNDRADMEVELLDMRWFQPVHLSLRWLNDYMIVRSPRLADRSTLSRLAEDLYEGEIADRLRHEARERAEALRLEWAESQAALQAQIDGVLGHMVEEIRQTTDRLRLGRTFLEEARQYISDLDQKIEAAHQRILEAQEGAAGIVGLTPDLMQDRFEMVANLLAEMELGDQAMAEAERQVVAQAERIDALERKLRSL